MQKSQEMMDKLDLVRTAHKHLKESGKAIIENSPEPTRPLLVNVPCKNKNKQIELPFDDMHSKE